MTTQFQQFSTDTMTFVGGEPMDGDDNPQGEIPDDARVSTMAQKALDKRFWQI